MEMHQHTLETLFEQLGLPSSHNDIQRFIEHYSQQLDHASPLHKADFWNHSQSAFLKEAKEEDADWAEVVDQLDNLLRSTAH